MNFVMPPIVFCADAGPQAGGGHMHRCLNLARSLKSSCHVAFVLPANRAPEWVATLQRENIAVVDALDPMARAAVAIIDGYAIEQSDVAEWKRRARTVVMVEDLGRRFEGVDLYISPSGPPPRHQRVLVGPDFALLDARYGEPVVARAMKNVTNVLVTCGLQDGADLSSLYLNALAVSRGPTENAAVTVVLGAMAPHREAVGRQAEAIGAQVVTKSSDMKTLYDAADLVLGAGGVSLFERMARGCASVTVITAENQTYSAKMMDELGGTRLVGCVNRVTVDAVAKAIHTLSANGDAREAMGLAAKNAVDGSGSDRVAREIAALAAKLQNSSASLADN
jgi:UDP-2,4-diacetamido-2,4,6-trideoxy-beta-L-altropyranose hydrolase